MEEHFISCAFTGYRLNKLGYGEDESDERLIRLRKSLSNEIRKMSLLGVKYFISGMCDGTDMIAASEVLRLREELNIELWLFIPFKQQPNKFSEYSKEEYARIIKQCNGKRIIYDSSQNLSYGAMFNGRNQYMINKSDALIAVYSNDTATASSGTRNTIKMAQKKGIKIVYINPQTAEASE